MTLNRKEKNTLTKNRNFHSLAIILAEAEMLSGSFRKGKADSDKKIVDKGNRFCGHYNQIRVNKCPLQETGHDLQFSNAYSSFVP